MATHVVGTFDDRRLTLQRLDAVAWGLFFLWVGIAFLTNLNWGIGLLGVGIIVLGGQAARRYVHLTLEVFWVVVGVLFIMGGVWELLSVRVGMIPIVCIVAGVLLLVSALRGRPRGQQV
jgi:hypothetical protein